MNNEFFAMESQMTRIISEDVGAPELRNEPVRADRAARHTPLIQKIIAALKLPKVSPAPACAPQGCGCD